MNAIGSVSIAYTDPFASYYDIVCTGALISADTVLTSKQCLYQFSSYGDGYRLVFAVGPDGTYPTAWYDVVEIEEAPGGYGGFNGSGHDFGVLHLATDVPDVEPVSLATVTADDVGQVFAGIGYGLIDNGGRKGPRRVGQLGLRGIEGSTYAAMYGNFEEFFLWWYGQPLPPECGSDAGEDDAGVAPLPEPGDAGYGDDTCWIVQQARIQYDSLQLEEFDEFVAGGAEGDAQPCYGDTGGPLLRADDAGRLVAYGVASGFVGSARQQCDHGAVYAGFDEEVLAFLDQAKQWVDPCGDVSWTGSCDGEVAQRCTNPGEGARRILSFDCGLIGLSCNVQDNGVLGCGTGDSAVYPPVLRPPPAFPLEDASQPVPGARAIAAAAVRPAGQGRSLQRP